MAEGYSAAASASLRGLPCDYGTTEDGTFHYVMELLEGFDLETLVAKFGPVPPDPEAAGSSFAPHRPEDLAGVGRHLDGLPAKGSERTTADHARDRAKPARREARESVDRGARAALARAQHRCLSPRPSKARDRARFLCRLC